MNSRAAQEILIACRPGTADLHTTEAREALEQVQRDPELHEWWIRQQAFQKRTRESVRQLAPPPGLREQILARAKIVEVPWWRKPGFLSAAAALVILAVAVTVFRDRAPADPLPTFRSRMVQNVLRQYSMDIKTNDMRVIRTFLDREGAPSDYQLPPGLARRPAMGAGVLSWQDRRVSMVCINSQTQGTLFLFVSDDPALRKPDKQREFVPVSDLMTVSWTENGKTYVLAGHGSREWLEQQL
jgi:hypothetical protein